MRTEETINNCYVEIRQDSFHLTKKKGTKKNIHHKISLTELNKNKEYLWIVKLCTE